MCPTPPSGLDQRTRPRSGPRPGPSGLAVGDLLTDEAITVDAPVPTVALAVGAHPDDIEFGAGGTLAKWSAAGCRVHHLVLTDGSKGSWDPAADLSELVSTRQRECRRAARVIDGAAPNANARPDRVEFLGSVDGELDNGPRERGAVVAAIRRLRPDVVLGHDPWRRYRLHPDHRAAGFLTVDAVVAARDPHFLTELDERPHRPDRLLLWEADLPNHVEDVGGFETIKVRALLCHTSQMASTMGIEPTGSDDSDHPSRRAFDRRVRHQLADHGWLAALPAGEAFRHIDDV